MKRKRTEYVKIQNAKLKSSTEKYGVYEIEGEEYTIPWKFVGLKSVDRDGQQGDLFVDKDQVWGLKLGVYANEE